MVLSKKEYEIISNQLGRKPRGVLKVTNYTKNGDPFVIVTDPILESSKLPSYHCGENLLTSKLIKNNNMTKVINTNQRSKADYEPFPTLYYLTYPAAIEAVSLLESKGLIKELERKIEAGNKLKKDFLKAQRQYIKDRLLFAGKRLNKLSKAKREVIEKTGVGGVRDLTKIKCFHAHCAHYLATGVNPIGEVIYGKLAKDSNCRTLNIRRWKDD